MTLESSIRKLLERLNEGTSRIIETGPAGATYSCPVYETRRQSDPRVWREIVEEVERLMEGS